MHISGLKSGNFVIEVRKRNVYVRVVPYIGNKASTEDGYAEALAAELHDFIHRPWLGARALILDMRAAPSITGPKTRTVLGELVENWEHAGRRVGVVAGEEPIKQVQLRTVIAKNAPGQGTVVASMAEAERWCAGGEDPELSERQPSNHR